MPIVNYGSTAADYRVPKFGCQAQENDRVIDFEL